MVAISCVVLFVQKLPFSVKNFLDGSNRPHTTFPHMHSRTGSPLKSRITHPASSLAHSLFLVGRVQVGTLWFHNKDNRLPL